MRSFGGRRGAVAAITVTLFSAGFAGLGPSATAQAGDSSAGDGALVIVVDSSGSMAEADGSGSSRMLAAQRGLVRVINDFPTDATVGLRVYGASISDGEGSCKDTQRLVDVGPVDQPSLRKAIKRMKPLGNTPIAHSLREAAKDLPKEGPRTILLVSDGEENCGGDPCKVAADLRKSGIDLAIDVVGLQVDSAARNQLACVASAGGGTYYDVKDLDKLPQTMERISTRAARGYAPEGMPVTGGLSLAEAVEVTDGEWLDTIGDVPERNYSIEVPEGGALHAAAVLRPTDLDMTGSEEIRIDVVNRDGRECAVGDRGSALGFFDKSRPITASMLVDAKQVEACGGGPLVVRVQAPETSQTRPLVLLTRTETEVTNLDTLPGPTEPVADVPAALEASGAGTAVTGSASYSGVPILTPGRYTDTIVSGEALYYGVDVDWGQQLTCQATIDASAPAARIIGHRSIEMSMKISTPMRRELSLLKQRGAASAGYQGDEAVQVRAASPTVRYLNREASDPDVRATHRAGTYYCVVFANPTTAKDDVGELPVTIDVAVTGTAGEGAPQFADRETPSEDEGQEASGSDASSEGSTALIWGAGAAVLGLLVVGTLIQRRRSRG